MLGHPLLPPPPRMRAEKSFDRDGWCPPPPGDSEASVPPIIDVAPATVPAATADEGFHVVLRTTGLKTTPLHLATVATTTLSPTQHSNMGGFNSFESSDGEDSPPLLPSPRPATGTHNKRLIDAISTITESEQRCSMAYVENFGKIT